MTIAMRTRDRLKGLSRRGVLPVAALTIACLLSAACGASSAHDSLPTGWHDITPSSQTLATYAISPDVPGLIFACIGAPSHVSADPPGPAVLWRTRDGGASWQQLNRDGYVGGCQVAMPAGGHGLVFALNMLGNEMLQVSANGGDSWRTLTLHYSEAYGGIQAEFALLAGAVYRDGALYAAGVATGQNDNGASMSTFSASNDDGLTWRAIEAVRDPLLKQGYIVQAIAADYRAPGAWFRLMAPSYGGGNAPVTLEHSINGGVTWTVVDTFGPNGIYYDRGRATLATSPTAPGRLCVGLEPDMITAQPQLTPSPGTSTTSMYHEVYSVIRMGPPYMPPRAVALMGSDDGGLHWSGATVANHTSDYGGMVPPGVAMGAHGTCYLAGTVSHFASSDKNQYAATIWRLVPNASAPEVVAALSQVGMNTLAVVPGSGAHDERLIADLLTISHTDTRTEPCGPGCTAYQYPGPDTPHLVWANVPD